MLIAIAYLAVARRTYQAQAQLVVLQQGDRPLSLHRQQ